MKKDFIINVIYQYKKYMRPIFTALFIIFISTIFCNDTEDMISYHPYYNPSFRNCSQGDIIEKSQIMPGLNAPARIDLSKNPDFFISASYLYFQPHEKGLIYAYSENDPNSNTSQVFEMHSNYKYGFRTSLGVSSNNDSWIFFLEYMRFHASKTKNLHQRLRSTWTSSTNVMTNIHAKWNLSMDLIDFMFSRPLYLGTRMILTPAFGVKGGWIDQKFNTDNERETDSAILTSRNILDSWLIGLNASIKLNYIFLYHLSCFGKLSTSLLYQDFNSKNRQNQPANPFDILDNSINNISYINPNMNIIMGFEWGLYFSKKTLHLSFLLGYENQIYWSQNLMMETHAHRTGGYLPEPGSLYLNGFVAKAKFDF